MVAAHARRRTFHTIKKLLSASSDGVVRLFKVKTGPKMEVALTKEFKEKQCTVL